MAEPWAGSTRRRRLPADWPAIRVRILERDGHRCTWIEGDQRCPARATDVDHIVRGDSHVDSNLTSLCRRHHLQKSSAEGHDARGRRQRPAEPHPGLAR